MNFDGVGMSTPFSVPETLVIVAFSIGWGGVEVESEEVVAAATGEGAATAGTGDSS